jgi:Fe-S oxidoreductase
MQIITGLDEVKEWLYGCTHCGTCGDVLKIFTPACPAGEKYQLESYSAAGKMFIARGVYEGKLSLSDDDIRERIYACTGCLSCQQQCGVYHHEHIFEVVQALRTEAVSQGLFNPAYMLMYYGLRNDDNVFGKHRAERGDWSKGLKVKYGSRDKVEVLYHAGCLLSFEPELWGVPRSVMAIMGAAGVEVGIMGAEETCCGGRAYEMGYMGEFTKYAQHNIENANALGVSTIVTSCSDGYSTFRNLYPKVNIGMKFRVLHIVEYLDQLIKEGRISFTGSIPLRVTYHDPCHLGRHVSPGVYEPPRDVLKSIPGITLVEMERNRENAWCCGAGGGVKQADPEMALWTANERLKEARATGAEALVTSCPWCEMNFRDAIKEFGGGIAVYDVAELVHRALSV